MGEFSAKQKGSSGAILRRTRGAVAAFRRDLRTEARGDARTDGRVADVRTTDVEDRARGVPAWGRIVFRSGATTLR